MRASRGTNPVIVSKRTQNKARPARVSVPRGASCGTRHRTPDRRRSRRPQTASLFARPRRRCAPTLRPPIVPIVAGQRRWSSMGSSQQDRPVDGPGTQACKAPPLLQSLPLLHHAFHCEGRGRRGRTAPTDRGDVAMVGILDCPRKGDTDRSTAHPRDLSLVFTTSMRR